jgi:hypothetical protein
VAHAFTLPGSVGLLLVMVVVALSSLDATWAATLGGAMLGWLFVTGFVINQFGELRIAGTGDAWRLLLLVGVAVTSAAARRWHVRTRTRTRVGWIVAASPAASAEPEAASRMFRGIAGRGLLSLRYPPRLRRTR